MLHACTTTTACTTTVTYTTTRTVCYCTWYHSYYSGGATIGIVTSTTTVTTNRAQVIMASACCYVRLASNVLVATTTSNRCCCWLVPSRQFQKTYSNVYIDTIVLSTTTARDGRDSVNHWRSLFTVMLFVIWLVNNCGILFCGAFLSLDIALFLGTFEGTAYIFHRCFTLTGTENDVKE